MTMKDYLQSEAIAALSASYDVVDWSRQHLQRPLPQPRPRWLHSIVQSSQDVADHDGWHTYTRQPESDHVALLSSRRDIVHMRLNEDDGQQAVAYALGSQLMIGIARRGNLFDNDSDDDRCYQVGIELPQGETRLQMGVLSSNGRFVSTMNKFQPVTIVSVEDVSAAVIRVYRT